MEAGLILVLAYLGLAPAMAVGPFRRFYLKMGGPRYYVGAFLFLFMLSLPMRNRMRKVLPASAVPRRSITVSGSGYAALVRP